VLLVYPQHFGGFHCSDGQRGSSTFYRGVLDGRAGLLLRRPRVQGAARGRDCQDESKGAVVYMIGRTMEASPLAFVGPHRAAICRFTQEFCAVDVSLRTLKHKDSTISVVWVTHNFAFLGMSFPFSHMSIYRALASLSILRRSPDVRFSP